MNWRKNKFTDFIQSTEEFSEIKSISFRDIINGRIFTRALVTKQGPFFVYLAFMGFLYIGNHYKMEELMRKVAGLNKELKELRYEAITTSSELMFMSKQSEVLKKVRANNLELEELTEPPRKLKVRK
nr:FtsL-like putative cell division protein [uncultured Carboxylicivirga sp.]